ncbi:MAG: sulfatase [Solirubrobacterales bacterium]|nr:sulfatase [Solirubrobacterales bacterium]
MNRRGLLKGAAAAGAASAIARLPGPASGAEGRRPNVLILMTDQERHQDRLPDHLPLPARCWLDANGTRIDRFSASSMACSPSRACFWTGMYAPQQGVYGTFVLGTQFTMDPSIPTIGDLFRELGYQTAFFGKWHL